MVQRCLLVKMLRGSHHSHSQSLFGAMVYQKCSLSGGGIVLLLFPLFQGLGAQPVASTAREEQRPCCPCSRAFLSALAIDPLGRVVMNTASVWGVKRPLLCFNDSPNAALIWCCQALIAFVVLIRAEALQLGCLVFSTAVSVVHLFVFKLIMDQC